MSLPQFSSLVAGRLVPEDQHGSFIEIVSIIALITKEVMPLIQDCLEDQELGNEQVGTVLTDYAKSCNSNTFVGRLRRVRLGLMLRRVTSIEERRVLGGISKIVDSYLEGVLDCDPQELTSAWNEAKS